MLMEKVSEMEMVAEMAVTVVAIETKFLEESFVAASVVAVGG